MTQKADGQHFAAGGLGAAIQNSAHALVITLDIEGRIAGFNRACELLSGYDADEIIGTHLWDRLLPEEAIEPIRQIFASLPEGGEIPEEYENAWVTRDGRRPIIAWNSSAARNVAGEIELIVGIGVDITEHKANSDRLARAQKIAKIGSWEWTIATGQEYWSDQVYRNLGLVPGCVEASVDKLYEHVHPDDREGVRRTIQATIETGKPYSFGFRVVWPDGTERFVHEEGEALLGDNGETVGLAGTMQDITERKAVEDKLRETAENLENAQRVARLGSWVWDVAEDKEWWSDEVYRIAGLEVGSVVLGEYDFLDYVHPDDREKAREAHDRSVREGVPYDVEYRFIRPDGAETVISEYGEMVYGANGEPLRMHGTAQDVTERKQAELALQQTMERLEEAQRIGQMGSWFWEPEEGVEWWSDQHYRIYGLEPGSVVLDGFGFLKCLHPDDRTRVEEIQRQAMENSTPFEVEYRVVWPDGTERIVAEQGERVENNFSGTLHWRGVVQDITERRAVEDKLRETAAQLENTQRIARLGTWSWDIVEDKEWWSEENIRMTGIEPGAKDFDGYSFLEFVHPDDRDRTRAALEKAVDEGTPYFAEYRFLRPDGREIVISEHGEIELDDAGKPIRMLGTAQDITEQKAVEEKLRETAENLENAQRIARLGSWVWDIKEDKEWWSDEIHRMLGTDAESPFLGGYNFLKYVHPGDRERVRAALDKSLKEQAPYVAEYRIQRTDGREIVIAEHAETEYDEAGKPVRMRGTTQDVTEYKQVEQALQESEARIDAFFNKAPVGLGIRDRECRYVKINETLAQMNGVSVETQLGKRPSDFMTPEKAEMS